MPGSILGERDVRFTFTVASHVADAFEASLAREGAVLYVRTEEDRHFRIPRRNVTIERCGPDGSLLVTAKVSVFLHAAAAQAPDYNRPHSTLAMLTVKPANDLLDPDLVARLESYRPKLPRRYSPRRLRMAPRRRRPA